MATREGTSENSVKRRGSYLSYLSNPVKKVPRTTNYRQKQSEKNCLPFEDKAISNNRDFSYASDDHNSDQTRVQEDCFNDCGDFDQVLEEVLAPKATEPSDRWIMSGGNYKPALLQWTL